MAILWLVIGLMLGGGVATVVMCCMNVSSTCEFELENIQLRAELENARSKEK